MADEGDRGGGRKKRASSKGGDKHHSKVYVGNFLFLGVGFYAALPGGAAWHSGKDRHRFLIIIVLLLPVVGHFQPTKSAYFSEKMLVFMCFALFYFVYIVAK